MLKGKKTIIFGAMLAGFGFLEETDLTNVIPPDYYPTAVVGIGLAVVVLRFLTTTPALKSE